MATDRRLVIVAVTGSRHTYPSVAAMAHFERLWEELGGQVLLHGDCRGPGDDPWPCQCEGPSRTCSHCHSVDRYVGRWCAERGRPVLTMPAHWARYGRAAGPIRNGVMARLANHLIAFPGGKGTANCVKQAQLQGVPVHFVEEPRRG